MQALGRNRHTQQWIPWSLIFSMTALSIPVSQAAPGDVNSINVGQNIQGGTYFNTPGSRTTFHNNGDSVFLQSGNLVRALESTPGATPNGNGGSVYIRGNVVRLDGTIDASAVRNGQLYTGNGGKVWVDSNYLFQNGNIFANGANGGVVQLNVGALTMGSNAKITAQGFGGNGGTIAINSPGAVDIQTGAVIDTSGKVMGTVDTNVINIEGSAINNQGILRANGLAAAGTDFKTDNGDTAVMSANPTLANNPVPGPISVGNGTNDTSMPNILFGSPSSADFRGGTIRLVANGQDNPVTAEINGSPILNSAEKTTVINRLNQVVSNNNGDILQRGTVQANGAINKDGGTVILSAARNVVNGTTIQANGASSVTGVFDANGSGGNGGNGGSIILTAMSVISNSGSLQVNGGNGAGAATVNVSTANNVNANATAGGTAGAGGTGGVVAFNSNTLVNSGNVQANGGVGGQGGHANSFDTESSAAGNPIANATSVGGAGGVGGTGGLVVFSGNANPTGNGSVNATGGQGGRGGNAWADSRSTTTTGTATANSTATSGAGGNGGQGGTIITVVPGTFGTTQTIATRAGGLGASGSSSFRKVTVKNGVTTTETGGAASIPGSVTVGNNTPIFATRRNEYISHAENGILFTQNGGAGNLVSTLSGRLNESLIRTVANPTGAAGSGGAALANAEAAANFVVASRASGLALNNDLVNSNLNPLFFNLNTLTILNNGNIDNNTLWTPGVHLVGEGFHDLTFSLGGGHISWLANGNITNNQIVMTRGLWTGGSINLAATQDLTNNNDFITIGPNKALLSGFSTSGPPFEASHSGSLIFKAGRDLVNSNTGKIQSNLIFFDIHPPLNQNPPIDWPKFLNGAQIGSKIYLLANRNLVNNGRIQADALTYRNGQAGLDNPALTTGGIIIGRHNTGTFTNTGIITADGDAFQSPNQADGPRFSTNTFPATTSFDGIVSIP